MWYLGCVTLLRALPLWFWLQIAWDYSPTLLRAWEDGKTGYPWIDAAMAQLKREGWMHHLARHAVACFLTRGDLYQSWEHGAKIFDKYLLDSDWALNNGWYPSAIACQVVSSLCNM